MSELPTLVIGDVHGHVDRLHSLLHQEGIVDEKGERFNRGVRVVQVGDLGHFGHGGDLAGDYACYQKAHDWLDTILWGNHDRPVVDENFGFGGYIDPKYSYPELYHAVKSLENSGKMALATHAHGYLITHAGLHPRFARHLIGGDADRVATDINAHPIDELVLAVSFARGGASPAGGILWRDDHQEQLSEFWPQIYGHTAQFGGPIVRHESNADPRGSWNVDVGGKTERSLGGVWLAEDEVRPVRVDL